MYLPEDPSVFYYTNMKVLLNALSAMSKGYLLSTEKARSFPSNNQMHIVPPFLVSLGLNRFYFLPQKHLVLEWRMDL